jgi:ATP-dependent DNA ligase
MQKPMMPVEIDKASLRNLVANTKVVVTKKYDGFRVLFHINNSGNKLYTRYGGNKVEQVPKFKTRIPELDNSILDGELIAKDETWYSTQSIIGSEPKESIRKQGEHGEAKLVLFDVLKYKGQDVKSLSLEERRKITEQAYSILKSKDLPIQIEKWATGDKSEFIRDELHTGEGVVIKDVKSSYVPGKHKNGWFKIKRKSTYDYVVTGVNTGKGKYSNTIGAVGYGGYDDGKLVEVGSSQGMDDTVREEMRAHPRRFVGKVAEFEATGMTPYGKMRHPRYKRLRLDKSPKSVRVSVD